LLTSARQKDAMKTGRTSVALIISSTVRNSCELSAAADARDDAMKCRSWLYKNEAAFTEAKIKII